MAMAVLADAAGHRCVLWHVDHGLRPSSAEDARVVKDLAERLGAGFELRRLEIEAGPDLEARARAARYDALPADVCVAHTADDRAETVLFNLARGSGLAGVAARFERVHRPLLDLRRSETRAVCDAAGLTPCRDAHNDDPRFTRVAIRHRLMPVLEEVMGRDPVPALVRHADRAADAHAVIADLAAGIDPTDVRALRSAPRAVAAEALREWLRSETGADHPVDTASIDRVLEVAEGNRVATEVVGGQRVARTAGRLRIEG